MAGGHNTMRRVVLVAAGVAAVVLIAAYFVLSNGGKPVSEEESSEMACEFLMNSPAFRYDGIQETIEHVETVHPYPIDRPYLWVFVFTFKCRHAGYGDRRGQTLLEVMTPHKAHIVVQESRVVPAVMDKRWDMIARKMIRGETLGA